MKPGGYWAPVVSQGVVILLKLPAVGSMTTKSIFGKETGAYDRFSKLVTPKGYPINTITQDTEVLHTDEHPETDAQGHIHSRHKWRQTHRQTPMQRRPLPTNTHRHIHGQRPSVCPQTPRSQVEAGWPMPLIFRVPRFPVSGTVGASKLRGGLCHHL